MLYVKTQESDKFCRIEHGPETVAYQNGEIFHSACGKWIPSGACTVLIGCNFELDRRRLCDRCLAAASVVSVSAVFRDYGTHSWIVCTLFKLFRLLFRRTESAGA